MAADRLGVDAAGAVRRIEHELGARILPHALVGTGQAQDFAVRAFADHVARRIFHRALRAEIAVDPFHDGVLVEERALGHEVVDIGGPVLDRGVAAPGAVLDENLDDGGVHRVGGVHRRAAAFDVMAKTVVIADDERALELAELLGVDAEVHRERDIAFHALGNVDERAAAPERGVERGELVVLGRNRFGEVFLEDVGILLHAFVATEEDDAPFGERFLDVVIGHLAVDLRAETAEKFLLFLGDAELVVGAADFIGTSSHLLADLSTGLM